MSKEKWNEAGRVWEDDQTWLDENQKTECARAHESAMFQSPMPTQMISNGEYIPAPQTQKQKQVEQRVQELSESASRKLGMDRRRFLASTGGMAAGFLAMNEVFGHFFDVHPIEMFEPEAYAQTGTPRDLFVFDDQGGMALRSGRSTRCGGFRFRRICGRSTVTRRLNSANFYGINPKGQFKPVPQDYEKRMTPALRKIMELPAQSAALGVEPSNSRFGWIRR